MEQLGVFWKLIHVKCFLDVNTCSNDIKRLEGQNVLPSNIPVPHHAHRILVRIEADTYLMNDSWCHDFIFVIKLIKCLLILTFDHQQ